MPTPEETKIAEAEAEADRLAKPELKTEGEANIVEQAKAGVSTLSPEMLAMMRKDSGKQKFTVRELLIPQLKIVQTSGGYMKRSSSEFIQGALEGQLIDTLSLVLRDGPISIIVVRFATTYIEAMPNMGPIVKLWGTDRSGYDNAVGPDVGARVNPKNGAEIRETGSYHILLLNADGSSLPCMMYIGSTGWKEARRLNTLLGAVELMGEDGPFTPPPYARVFQLTTVPMANEKNSWMSHKFALGPMTLEMKYGMALYTKCRDFEVSIDKGIVKVHGPVEDERMSGEAGTGTRRPVQEQGVGPRDDPPPPASEEDYGAGGGAALQPDVSKKENIAEKAKKAPF
jgi:hypothetical protein